MLRRAVHRALPIFPRAPAFPRPLCRSAFLPLPPPRCFSDSSAPFEFTSSTSSTFMEFIRSALKRDPSALDRTAIRVDKKSYSYSQILTSAWHISDLLRNIYLKSENGSTQCAMYPLSGKENGRGSHLQGARIGIVAKPSAEFVSGLLGTWLGGGVAVPLAISYPEAELLHVMNDSEVSVLLSLEEHQEVMRRMADKCAAQFSLIPDISNTAPRIDANDNLGPVYLVEIMASEIAEEKDPALIVYTSGTTGKPKGVVHTHKSIAAQVQILAQAWEYSSNDQFLHCLPLHHVHGLFNALLAPLYAGAAVEFIPKFSVRGIWQRWRESYSDDGIKSDDAITVFTGVPTMYTRLLQGYESMDPGLQSSSAAAAQQLRLMMCGSSALPFPVMKQWESVTGHQLLERYGMTEFVMAISNPLRGARKGGTVGKPLPHVEAKILAEDESSKDLEGVGELCIKSPSLFKEYWKRPEVTKESFTDDGFFKTGDTVKMDEDGYYIILGRTSADIMKVGGYKLSALEIESVLLEHPVISECAVLGLPDKDYGEAVCAIIVPQEDAKNIAQKESKPVLKLDEIETWCKEKLAAYKIPTIFFIWDTLPRNAMGKVNKKELRKLVEA